jgi:hypothetical protein
MDSKMQQALAELEKSREFVRNARALIDAANRDRDKALSIRRQAADVLNPALQSARVVAWDSRVDGQRDGITLARLSEGDPLVRDLNNRQFKEPPTLYSYTLSWIVAVPQGIEHQFRQGQAFAVGGTLGDFDEMLSRFNFPRF